MENHPKELQYALNTLWFVLAGALVMWMAAGFSMLEAGLVRTKNTTEILTKNVALYAHRLHHVPAGRLQPDVRRGQLASSAAASCSAASPARTGVSMVGDDGPTHAMHADFFFQVVFVATAMSIVSGAVAERMKLWAFLAFAVVMTGVIYPIQGHWSWGGGFLADLGYSDYAGSGIVHLAGAAAALAGVLLLGARKGKYGPKGEVRAIPGANLPLATLGTFILWLGWFGFNGGSELAMRPRARRTRSPPCSSTPTRRRPVAWWPRCSCPPAVRQGRPHHGAQRCAGRAGGHHGRAQHADARCSRPRIGAVGGVLVVVSIMALDKLRSTTRSARSRCTAPSGSGACWRCCCRTRTRPLGGQLAGLAAIFGFVFVASLAVWFVLRWLMGIRVSEAEEYEGVDLAECGMQAYPEFVSTPFAASGDMPTGGARREDEGLSSAALSPSSSPAA